MTYAEFVHLRVHSAYSLSQGALRCKEIAALCRRHRMPAAAITDSNNLFGAFEFSEVMATQGVQPIIGCQLNLGLKDEDTHGPARNQGATPVVLLAQNEAGYRCLMRLSSKAFLDTAPQLLPQVGMADLADNEGLILLTGGVFGPVGHYLLKGKRAAAEKLVTELARLFPGRTYVELQRHGSPFEAEIEPALLEMADRLGLPLVATNDCYFADADMFEASDALLCINEGAFVGQPDRRRLTPEHRFRSGEEMRLVFADLPEAADNTLTIAKRCAFMVEGGPPRLPRFPCQNGQSEEETLRQKAQAGLKRRLAEITQDRRITAVDPYWARLDYELDGISRMGFAGYFLVVADIIQWAKAQKIPVGPGRGSGAGSLVAWALTITDIDPIRFGLLFERFLNPDRVSMPDFDIDFCQERRDEVIRYVAQKYGADRVAHIITFGKLQARAALRDVGRVLQLPLGQVDRIAKMVPNNPAHPVRLADAIAGEPRLQAERDRDEGVKRMIEIALKLEGLYRNASTHAAGVVIADRPLTELVPLYRDPRANLPATQFAMKYAEAAGLVKFDFLGLKTLSVLAKAVELLRRRGIDLDLSTLALDDGPTFALLGQGESVGLFQLESSGMREALRQLKPDCFEDIIAMVALYRPGPMENIPRYIRCKHKLETPDYLHPSLIPVLEETYGVVIYQEQVMEIAKVLSGYSLAEADLLRRAMGKKIRSEMDSQRERFVAGARANGVAQAQAQHIFELVEKFAGYGFNKSHAAAYALIAYQTAYLKAHHPVEFLAATMSFELANTDKLNFFRQELQRLNIALLPPEINRSDWAFSVETGAGGQGAIRYALAAIKNVGAAAVREIVRERRERGPFRDLADFAGRLPAEARNKRLLESLAKAGAFDALDGNRARVFAGVETLLRHAGSALGADGSQVSLFRDAGHSLLVLPDCAPWSSMDRLTREFEAVGFYLHAHPLDVFAKTLARSGVVRYAEILRTVGPSPSRQRIAGTVIGRQERTSARGHRFAFVQCSDPTGMFELTVFSDLLSANRESLEAGQSLIFDVDARSDGDRVKLTAHGMEPLHRATARLAAGLKVRVTDERPLAQLKALLVGAGRGRGPVIVGVQLPESEEEAEVKLPGGFAISPDLRDRIGSLDGVLAAEEI
jgi:DNA polymerase-3 subunit alpha